jgi:hypothetical protein
VLYLSACAFERGEERRGEEMEREKRDEQRSEQKSEGTGLDRPRRAPSLLLCWANQGSINFRLSAHKSY